VTRTANRRIPGILVAGLLVVFAAIAAALGYQSLASSASTAASPVDVPRSGRRGGLDPALVGALRQATADAAHDGVELYVKSGRRSPEYQQQLLNEAISKYGSEAEAARWVATPDTSPHVSGNAVDIGPSDATAWLSEHGADYGLCQIYSNEPWHYELRPEAIGHGCPPIYADPTHDPRMQQ
jgi:zinc D-Ala-D-Ala carboxypeptidase